MKIESIASEFRITNGENSIGFNEDLGIGKRKKRKPSNNSLSSHTHSSGKT